MAINIIRFFLLLLLLFFSKVSAQNTKPEQQFDKWYDVVNRSISGDGKWSVFAKVYDPSVYITVLLNTKTGDTINLKGVTNTFLDNHLFAGLQGKGVLQLMDLKTAERSIVSNVASFYFSKGLAYGFAVSRDKELIRLNKAAKPVTVAEGVFKAEALNDDLLLIVSGRSSFIVSRKSGRITTVLEAVTSKNFKCQTSDPDIGISKFLLNSEGKLKVVYYAWTGRKVFEKDLDQSVDAYSDFRFGDKDMLIATRPVRKIAYKDSIEQWSGEDKELRPGIDRKNPTNFDALLLDVNSGKKILNPDATEVTQRYLIADDQYLMEVLNYANSDLNTEFLIPSIRIRNVHSGEIEFQVQKAKNFYPTRDGFLFYFEGQDWWMYDLKKKVSSNLTGLLKEEFYHYNRLNHNNTSPVGDLHFSKNLKKCYFTSKNNIWEYDRETKRWTNRTKSDDPQISFRIINQSMGKSDHLKWGAYRIIKEDYIPLKILHRDEVREGLAVIQGQRMEIVEPVDLYHMDHVVCTDLRFSYTKENANLPIVVKQYKTEAQQPSDIFRSNTENYRASEFPESVIIPYRDRDQLETYVSVVLPPNYNPQKKYPAIVRVYENTAAAFKAFYRPSYYNEPGFNRTLAALQDYIIILPRITYKINEPGNSALTAVEDALAVVSKRYSVDLTKLGISGESFGGFETNYIIAHSGMFRVAVSGASLSDITADYFTMSKNNFRANVWRYSDQSFRFSGDFYSNKEVYYQNNPVFHSDKINTPLLLWAGKEDYHVNWSQSVAMYIALRSLQKPVKLFLFPGDAHTLTKPENQVKATKHFLNWFNQYLK